MHIPTWSRGHVPCGHPGTEVMGGDVVDAPRAILPRDSLPVTTNGCHWRRIGLCFFMCGLGNRMSQDPFSFAI
jgi:hypothetical protein